MQVIAMTREMGSLGKDVAARIAEKQGRSVIYHEMIAQAADKMRLRKSHVVRLLEKGTGFWQQLTADRTSLSIFTADETFRLLMDGNAAVIRGWGAVHLLSPIQHVIRVRICAPLELRVQRMMERMGTDDAAAVRREIEMAEEAHTAIVKRHFGVNWRDSEHYDLVLSTERMSVEECVTEVESAMALPRFQPTAQSQALVRSLALEWAVRAQLRRDPRTAGIELRIACEDGVVRATGCIDKPALANAIPDAIRQVPGVRSVVTELRDVSSAASARAEARPRHYTNDALT